MSAIQSRGPSRRRRRAETPEGTTSTHRLASLCIVIAALLNISRMPRCRAFSVPPSSSLPFPNPATPEEAVQNQLFHYQNSDLQSAYECCSPSNREVTGSLSEFERQVGVPPYDLILGHERADVLLEIVPDGVPNDENGILEMSCCLVCIRPNENARRRYPVWFWWEMSLLRVDEGEADDTGTTGAPSPVATSTDGSSMKGCKWMVDCILPDFEDLDFETESLSIEQLGGEDFDDEDEVTIYWDFDA